MRRWILLGILVITATWAGSTVFRRHRQAVQDQREAVQAEREGAKSEAFHRAAEAFYTQKYALAEKLITDLLPEAEKYPNRHRLAELLSMLGTSYASEHKPQEAEPALKRSLEVYRSLSPLDPLGTERTELNLGNIYLDRGDYAVAEPYLTDARLLSEKTPGQPRYERGAILLHLGILREMQGHYLEAERLLNGSVDTLQADSASWSQTDLASAFYWLGGVYRLENQYSQAIEFYQKAQSLQEKLLGPNGLEVSHTLRGLGEVYQAEGQFARAAEFLNRAERIAQSSAGPRDNSRAAALLSRGEAAEDSGRYAQAESLYEQAIEVDGKTVGPEDPDFALALIYLGCLYRDQQQFDISQADPLLERALAIREKALGPEHPLTGSVLSDLALTKFYEHKFEEAERFAERALPIQEKGYGLESLEVSTTLNRLGLAQRDLHELPQAETSLRRALAIREKDLLPDHQWIAISLGNLASVYMAQGESAKAAPLIERARTIRAHSSAR